MKKFLSCIVAVFMACSMAISMAACGGSADCKHENVTQATCELGAICPDCGKNMGQATGHSWQAATCDKPKTCSVCGKSEGAALGHSWQAATCDKPKTCSVCGKSEGAALGHAWQDATCTQPKTCETCGKTQGTALGHDYTETIVTAASCTGSGTKKYTCNNCTDSYTASYSLDKFTAQEVYANATKSSAEIATFDKSGSGLALGSGLVYKADGQIITNYHVIENAISAKVTVGGKTYSVESVLAYSSTIDLAVLKINAVGLTPVTICNKTHSVGSTVYALGSSEGLTDTFTTGSITTAERTIDGVKYVQHDASINSGNSGGMLLNAYGEVIGVNTWTVRDSQNLNFAIKTSEIDNLSFGTPITLEELFGVDPFTAVKTYTVKNGSLNSSGTRYSYVFYNGKSNNGTIIGGISYYEIATGTLSFALIYGDYMVDLEYDESTKKYEWTMYDSTTQYIMIGVLNPATFTSTQTTMVYTSTTAPSSLRTTFNKLATTMTQLLIPIMNTKFATIGVTAKDLGFTNF